MTFSNKMDDKNKKAIHEEIAKSSEDLDTEEEKEPIWKGPLKWIIAGFLLLIIVLWVVPYYAFPPDPNPDRIPTLSEVIPEGMNISTEKQNITITEALKKFSDPNDPAIKQAATRIASISCTSSSKVCHSKAIYYFVRDNVKYVADPVGEEYVEPAREVLSNKGGDCESGTLLMAALMEADGIESQIVFISGHAFLRIKLDEASNHYKKDGWIYLDWTCKECRFGEVPDSDMSPGMSFLDVSRQ
jgi:hypothetical protein